MAVIGTDCELILDGQGYFIKPDTYQIKQPRIRQEVKEQTSPRVMFFSADLRCTKPIKHQYCELKAKRGRGRTRKFQVWHTVRKKQKEGTF